MTAYVCKPKHTPGPWRAAIGDRYRPEDGECRDELACIPHSSYDAVDVFASRQALSSAEHEANAHLIAAAPDLLESLREMCHLVARCEIWLDNPIDGMEDTRYKAAAAISKASGQ